MFREDRRPEQGESTRGGISPLLVRGVQGISPEKKFIFKMSVEAILMHFETMFACEIRLIVQAFHVVVFKHVSNATTKECTPIQPLNRSHQAMA